MAKGRNNGYEGGSPGILAVLGILLIALGVVAILAVTGTVSGDIFVSVKNIMCGLAGNLNYGVSGLVIWLGLILTFASGKVSGRTWFLSLIIFLCVLGIIGVVSNIGTRSFVEGIRYDNETSYSVIDAGGYWSELRGAFTYNCRNAMNGKPLQAGAMGMILAWPVERFLGRIFGTFILGLISLICLLFIFRFDVFKAADRIRERTDRSREAHQRRREQEMIRQQMEEVQQRSQEGGNRRENGFFARSRQKKQNAAAAQPQQQAQPQQAAQPQYAGYPPFAFPGYVMPGMVPQAQQPQAQYQGQPQIQPQGQTQEIYDEIVMPQNAQPLWQSMPAQNGTAQDAAAQAASQKKNRSAGGATLPSANRKKAYNRLDEISRKKAQLSEEIAGDEQAKAASRAAAGYQVSTEQEPRQKPAEVPAAPAGQDNTRQPMGYSQAPAEPVSAPANAYQSPVADPYQAYARQVKQEPQPVPAAEKPAPVYTPNEEPARPAQNHANPPVSRQQPAADAFAGFEAEEPGDSSSGFRSTGTAAPARQAQEKRAPVSPVQPAEPVQPLKVTNYSSNAFENDEDQPRQQNSHRPATAPIIVPPKAEENREYAYPTLDLLEMSPRVAKADTSAADAESAAKLEQTLESFGIPAQVQRVTHGPAVTRFELGLTASGINVKRIQSIDSNIALEMAANGGVRIEIPIPGTNLFGVEIPNRQVEAVRLSDVICSEEMRNAKSPLTVALGRDIAGKPVLCDLAKMPHLLIAGQTGSGKSVCVNTIINSILYRSSPAQVKMIMIDPKVVELQYYNSIPHLLTPVVSDPHKAAGALAWAVAEMLDRYRKMQAKNVRELNAYNEKLGPDEEKLPRIVIIIDELADLMLACKKEVEESIIRIAQLARAAGIHMVVATQRPTVDVITGLIKANIPSRIAFAVSSSIDSRTILDQNGAEKLLGRGDMFYFPTGASAPIRVQGCFMNDAEIERVVDFIGSRCPVQFDEDVMDKLEDSKSAENTGYDDDPEGADPLLPEAIQLVVTTQQASISMLQRRMKIGHSRAGRLVDDMAARGIVSEAAGSKPREVLMTREEYEKIRDTL